MCSPQEPGTPSVSNSPASPSPSYYVRVAWDRDVVGGDWEDVKLEWVGKPTGPDGVLMGDERGRVIIRSRPMNGYVSWNGSRFSHVPSREGAAVFTFQRMAPSLGIGGSGALRRGVTGSGREPSIREKY